MAKLPKLKPALRRYVSRRDAVPPSQRWITARNVALRLTGLPGFSWLLRPVLTSNAESVVEPTDEAAGIRSTLR